MGSVTSVGNLLAFGLRGVVVGCRFWCRFRSAQGAEGEPVFLPVGDDLPIKNHNLPLTVVAKGSCVFSEVSGIRVCVAFHGDTWVEGVLLLRLLKPYSKTSMG